MSGTADALRLEYLPASQLASRSPEALSHVLGGACFSRAACVPDLAGLPMLSVDMPVFAAEADTLCEIWHSADPLTAGQQGEIRFRQSDTLLFGCMSLDESAAGLRGATEQAYQSIFALLAELDYAALLRVWNYFPAINEATDEIERYRQFNIGRQEAFLAQGRSVINNVPAACALGSAAGHFNIAFLATRTPVRGIENPRQVSAFHYPDQYGPRSPTFARAGLTNLGGQDLLFVSGTASIVGHQTRHEGDVAAQTRECLENIAAVVAEANRVAGQDHFRLEDLAYKVYVRHPENLALVRQVMAEFFSGPASAVFLQADVCRADLLVEIEASGGHAVTLAPSVIGR